MSWLSFILLGLALAVDCFAVSLCLGLLGRRATLKHTLTPPFFFGLFQALMPLAGWGIGLAVLPLITGFDHWLAFILLLGVGGHMLKEAWSQHKNPCCEALPSPLTELGGRRFFITLTTLALATSLDALAVGLGLAFAEVSLWIPALLIGAITFLVSLAGICLGQSLGRFIQGAHYAVALGGCVLIGIGFKILMEHGVFQNFSFWA